MFVFPQRGLLHEAYNPVRSQVTGADAVALLEGSSPVALMAPLPNTIR